METNENLEVPTEQTSSLLTRITNVFASPGELFTELKESKPQTTSWLIPLIISILMAFFVIAAIQLNESLKFQVKEIQAEKMQELVQEGRMTQEQADMATSRTGSSQSFIIFGGISATIMTIVLFFLITLIFWLAAKFGLKFTGGYTKILELYGLTTLITSLGSIVTVLLMYVFDSIRVTPSAAIFVYESFDIKNNFHIIMSQLNIFTIWQIGILGYGLAKLSNKPTSAGLVLSYALWLIWVIASTFMGLGFR
ncbi:MAG: hypothetical protein IGBAC_1379 [Ignavibacteriae bacterium]|nr:MAG: hypothetical protein IGBAC_1379 [Ignavibacteriota bacterium]